MKLLATFAVATMVIGSALAVGPAKKPQGSAANWSLNLGMGFPQGDHKDAGVDSMFMVGLDYALGMLGDGSNASSFVGAAALFGDGDAGSSSRSWGVHYGVLFGLGDQNSDTPLKIKLKGGYYNTRLEASTPADFTSNENKWGFGGTASIVWAPKSSMSSNFNIEFGYYFMPEVSGVNNNGWFVAVGIPFGGK